MSTVSASRAQAREAAPLFAALGDETRLQLLLRLSTHGPASITELSADAAVTRQAITKHLEVLRGCGLVRRQRRGRESIWQIELRRLTDAHDHLDRIAAQWSSALERLRSHLGE